jgi:hypothetical protein
MANTCVLASSDFDHILFVLPGVRTAASPHVAAPAPLQSRNVTSEDERKPSPARKRKRRRRRGDPTEINDSENSFSGRINPSWNFPDL